MRTRLPVLVLVMAVLAIAGCGSSSKTGSSASSTSAGSTSPATTASSTTTPASTTASAGPPLSKSQLVARADAICKQLNAGLDSEKNKVRTQQDIIRVVALRVGLEQTALTELSKLTPSASMAQDYQQLLKTRQTLIEDTKKLGEDAAANNSKAETPVYVSSAALIRQMAKTAKHDGLTYCGALG
jgi:hypothetical protein